MKLRLIPILGSIALLTLSANGAATNLPVAVVGSLSVSNATGLIKAPVTPAQFRAANAISSTNDLAAETAARIAGDLAGTNYAAAVALAAAQASSNHTHSATNALDIALRALIAASTNANTAAWQAATNALDVALRIVIAVATNNITLQEVVTRGGTVTSGAVTIDAANARTNTFGGLVTVVGKNLQGGYNTGTRIIHPSNMGAIQFGNNSGTQTVHGGTGVRQLSWNTGTQTIGANGHGCAQIGRNASTQTIDAGSYGATQIGRNNGVQYIGSYAYGAHQIGYVRAGCVATNNASGAVQLLDLTNGQVAVTTPGGMSSLMLGAGVSSNRNAIVAGDGSRSHGDGSITASGGFYDGNERVATVEQLNNSNALDRAFSTNNSVLTRAGLFLTNGTHWLDRRTGTLHGETRLGDGMSVSSLQIRDNALLTDGDGDPWYSGSSERVYTHAVSNAVREILASMRYSWTPATSNTTSVGTQAKPIRSIHASTGTFSTVSVSSNTIVIGNTQIKASPGGGDVTIQGGGTTGLVAYVSEVDAAYDNALDMCTNAANLRNLPAIAGNGLTVSGGKLTASGSTFVSCKVFFTNSVTLTSNASQTLHILDGFATTNGSGCAGWDYGGLLDVANRRIKFSSAGAGRYAGYVHLYGEGLADTTYVLLKASVVTGTTTSLVGQVAAAEGADTASWFYATIPLSFRAETNSVLIIQYWNSDTDAGAEKIAWYADNAALQELYLLKID